MAKTEEELKETFSTGQKPTGDDFADLIDGVKGDKGDKGETGVEGKAGAKGAAGKAGEKGVAGVDGKDFVGTEEYTSIISRLDALEKTE